MLKTIPIEKDIESIIMPENLKIGMMIQRHRDELKEGKHDFDYHSFVMGQSPFHVPKAIEEALAKNAGKNHYAPAKGIDALRESIADYNNRHFGMNVDKERIVIAPGTKMLVYMLLKTLDGHVILPTPAWIGYKPILDYLGTSYERMRLKADNGYKVDPDVLDARMKKSKKSPILIMNNPHNPTGAVHTEEELKQITEVCRHHGALVIADEIYALITYNQPSFTSMGRLYPEGTFVTNGLSKDRSAAGYRLGTCILPTTDTKRLSDIFTAYASTIYTNTTTPIQYAAITAYQENKSIEAYMDATREIHRMTGQIISERAGEIDGLKASVPEGGFYFTLDFNALKPELKAKGIARASELSHALLEPPYHVALITGDAIAIDEDDFIARIAFVDYEGKAVYERYLEERPSGKKEELKFVNKHMSHMLEAFDKLEHFVREINTNP